MNNVMLDLETLGTGANSAILSIGAVEMDFDSLALGREFYVVIDRQSCFDLGCTSDPATLKWWSDQSSEARTVLSEPGIAADKALAQFSIWAPDYMELWGNGSDFDNAMLAELYRKVGSETPWKFFNNRCYRTMKNMFPRVTFMRQGTHHNALDDAKSQAMHMLKIVERMKDRNMA